GNDPADVRSITLTASGGPFRDWSAERFAGATPAEAVKHPNWDMGAKITIDSASLMNKGLEVIEARWLFNLPAEQIEVLVHPQSIVHSMVQFEDGSMKAQLGLPDMKLPIQYALAYPARIKNDFPRLDFSRSGQLSFEEPDMQTFRNLGLAYEALKKGGNLPCILNAANEAVVQAFLEGRVGFLQMPDIIETCMQKIGFLPQPSYEDYVLTDGETRQLALSLLANSRVVH
ncbi:MAG TPA: 1-deoxy-D-xylulose-5-phosphate reductoisomerase, partial [Anseongella sp.]|nr:1-deoxy-D-xylulose-5-phosphate reductoisomerase [Anseongella sp.]